MRQSPGFKSTKVISLARITLLVACYVAIYLVAADVFLKDAKVIRAYRNPLFAEVFIPAAWLEAKVARYPVAVAQLPNADSLFFREKYEAKP